MTAVPMTLEDALHYQGFTIDPQDFAARTITVSTGSIVLPARTISVLTWQRAPITEQAGDDLYLSSLPLFSEDYRPVLLSSILDRYRTRRLAYNTPGEWQLAFRRWGNLNMTPYNLRYASTAVALPLDDRDAVDAGTLTRHGLDVASDFPQSLIAGDTDYATDATDRKQADNTNLHRTGRETSIMDLLQQQRATYLNVDAEVMEGLDTLFLGMFDQGESGAPNVYAPPRGPIPWNPGGWPGGW